MKLHSVLSNVKRLAIDIDGDVLNVAYRPNVITTEFKSKLVGFAERIDSVRAEDEDKDDLRQGLLSIQMSAEMSDIYVKQLVAFVAEWDLTEDDGQMVALTSERVGQLPERFIQTVMQAINQDNRPDPTKPSRSRAT